MNKKRTQLISNALVVITLLILLLNINYTYLDWKDYATIAGSAIIVLILVVNTLRGKR